MQYGSHNIERTAAHEASHAIAAVAICLPVTRCSAMPDGELNDGATDFAWPNKTTLGRWLCLIAVVAGDVGVKLLGLGDLRGDETRRIDFGSDGRLADELANQLSKYDPRSAIYKAEDIALTILNQNRVALDIARAKLAAGEIITGAFLEPLVMPFTLPPDPAPQQER